MPTKRKLAARRVFIPSATRPGRCAFLRPKRISLSRSLSTSAAPHPAYRKAPYQLPHVAHALLRAAPPAAHLETPGSRALGNIHSKNTGRVAPLLAAPMA